MTPLESAAADLLFALYRAWYLLPYKATRLRLDAERTALAAALRAPTDPLPALRSFVASVDLLPRVRDEAGAALRGLASLLSSDGSALDADGRTRLAVLAATDDPFAAALQSMFWQPPALQPALAAIRPLLADPRLPAADLTRAEAVYARLDERLPLLRSSHAETAAALQQALADLETVPALRRLAWRELLNAKVVSQREIVARLGGGSALESLDALPSAPALPVEAVTADTAAGSATDAATDAAPGGVAVPLFSDITFPRTVKRSTTHWEPLIVRLTPTPQESSVATTALTLQFANPSLPEQVEVLLTAPDFDERFGLWNRTMTVFGDRASEPAVFLVRSNVPGEKRFTVDFYHHGRYLGGAAFQTVVGDATAPGRAQPVGEPAALDGLLAQPPPPADLELRIVRATDENRLTFTLHSARADVGFHWTPAGEVLLTAANPFDFLERKFERLSQLAAQSGDTQTPENSGKALALTSAIGEEMWDEVVPALFKSQFWPEIRRLRETQRIRSLLITSDEPWIPWEIVKPYTRDEVSGDESGEPFWAEQFELARWLSGRGATDRTPVRAARLVAPDLDLAWVEEEKRAIDSLAQQGILTAPPLRTRAEMAALLVEGGAELIHVAAHGSFDVSDPARSRLTLQDGPITPEELSPSATKGLRQARPLVFFNACSVGRLGLDLTGLGGWADRLIHTGRVGAFVGTLWEVNDRLAAEFAAHFYARLFEDTPLGEAFHAARIYIRDLDPANPTWLAYTLYGDPNCRISASPQP